MKSDIMGLNRVKENIMCLTKPATIVNGDFLGKSCTSGYWSGKAFVRVGLTKRLPIDESTVVRYEIIPTTRGGSRHFRYAKIYWKGGKKSLIRCNKTFGFGEVFLDSLIVNVPMWSKDKK